MRAIAPELNPNLEKVKYYSAKSLFFLCTEILGYKDWDKVHDDLEVFLARYAKKKAILLPRNHLKTSICTIGKSIQEMLKNPNIRILIANQIWDKSREMLSEIKQHLEGKSILPHIFGAFKSEKWNTDNIVINQRTKALKEPTVSTTGVEAESTGGHYDLIFLDDLMGLQNSQTPEQREKVKRFRRSMIDLLEPEGTLVEIGTRWHLDDTFDEVFKKERKYYEVMIRQVVENGVCIFPKKFNKRFNEKFRIWEPSEAPCMDFIDHLKTIHTPAEFNAQYLNNPIDEENQIFKKGFFRYWNQRPPVLTVSLKVDPAISLKQEADYTAITVTGMDPAGNIYVLDYLKGHWTPYEIVDNIFKMHMKWKPQDAGLETVGFQRTLRYSLEEEMRKRRYFFPVSEVKTSNQSSKEMKIKSLEPFYRNGMVFHAAWMQGKDLEDELTSFPRGKHDDLIDSLAMHLESLTPGTEQQTQEVPVGSWEYHAREARRRDGRYRSFFEIG